MGSRPIVYVFYVFKGEKRSDIHVKIARESFALSKNERALPHFDLIQGLVPRQKEQFGERHLQPLDKKPHFHVGYVANRCPRPFF